MPADFITSAQSYANPVSSSTLHVGSILAGDIICVFGAIFGPSSVFWKVTDNLGNGSAVDSLGNPVYAKGAAQSIGTAVGGLWAISLIDGDLTVTSEAFTSPAFTTPIVGGQLTEVRVYRFPKVYGIDQGSVGIGAIGPDFGFNQAYGSGDFTLADTLVVTGHFSPTSVADFTSLTGDTLQDTVIQPSGGPFVPERWLLILDRSSTGPGSGFVKFEYNGTSGPGGYSSTAVMTFSAPLADPGGLRLLGGRQYAARGGAGFDNDPLPSNGDQQADWNRPIVISFPYEVKAGDLLFVDVFVPRDPDTIVISDEYYKTAIFPLNLYNIYNQQILSPPTGSGSGGINGHLATYTCMVDWVPHPPHLGIQAGGIFQVKLSVSAAGSGAVYQATAIAVTAVTVAGPPTNIAVAGLKSLTQVVQNQLMATDEIPSVPLGSYLHAFAAYLPNQTQTALSWTEMEDYVIGASWDIFQFAGQITNRPRICALAVMDKFAPSADDYDAQVTAVLPAFSASGGIVLLAVSLPSRLTLVKEVVDGSASAEDWILSASGPTPISGAGGVVAPVDIGTYDLEESTGPAGYTGPVWVCVGGTQTGPASVLIDPGDDVVCTATNAFTEPPPPPPPTSGGKSMRYQIPQKRWFPHSYADEIAYHYLDEPRTNQPNDLQLLLLRDTNVLKSGGNDDDGTAIQSVAQLPSNDGGDQRIQKLYVDSIVDADSVGATEDLAVTLLYDNAVTAGPTYTLTPGTARAQFIQNISSLVALGLHRNIAPRFAWTGGPDGPRIYAYEPAGFAQPYISKFFVTQFITLAFTGWKHARRCYPALISTADVIFTIKTQDGRSYVTTIPSTGGQFMVQPLMVPQDCKDLSFAFQLDGQGTDFAFFPGDFTVEFKEWQQPEYIRLAVLQT